MNQLTAVLATQKANRVQTYDLSPHSRIAFAASSAYVLIEKIEKYKTEVFSTCGPQAYHSRSRQSRVKTKSLSHALRKCGPQLAEIRRTTAGALRELLERVGLGPS